MQEDPCERQALFLAARQGLIPGTFLPEALGEVAEPNFHKGFRDFLGAAQRADRHVGPLRQHEQLRPPRQRSGLCGGCRRLSEPRQRTDNLEPSRTDKEQRTPTGQGAYATLHRKPLKHLLCVARKTAGFLNSLLAIFAVLSIERARAI